MRTILALLLLTTSAALAQITPLRNAVLQSRLQANGHAIENAGNITVGTADLGAPGTIEVTTVTINATGDDLFSSGASLTLGEGTTWTVVEDDFGSGFGTYWQENGNGWTYFIDGGSAADAAAALQGGFGDLGIYDGVTRDGNVLTLPLPDPSAQEDITSSNASQIIVNVVTQGADAVPPSGTGVVVTTTGNVTRVVDGTVQQSGGDVFTQEGTGKLWRLKITGTESAPVLTLQSID